MIVICKIRDVSLIDSDGCRSRLGGSFNIDGELQELDIGEEYFVYCVEIFGDRGVWIYIETNAPGQFPSPYPVEFFDFVDTTMPSNWIVNFDRNLNGTELRRISFPEWANDDFFYERLISQEHAGDLNIYRSNRVSGLDKP